MQIRFFVVFCLGMAGHSLAAKAIADGTIADGGCLILSMCAGFMAAMVARTA